MSKIMKRGVDMFPTTLNATRPESRIFVIGLQPSSDSLTAINRWRDKGYDDDTIWGTFATALTRFFTRNYAVPVMCESKSIASELLFTCEELLESMLPNFKLLTYLKSAGFKSLNDASFTVSVNRWRVTLTVDYFPFWQRHY